VLRVCDLIDANFDIIEKDDKINRNLSLPGYRSVQYLVRFPRETCGNPENRKYANLVAEVQVRTVLQHAWAEIEHDIQYRSFTALPDQLRRRFVILAGLIEIADKEFVTR
jgi:ppGpp synthetase/RelA/SpoT-type nucleotidyltranferase